MTIKGKTNKFKKNQVFNWKRTTLIQADDTHGDRKCIFRFSLYAFLASDINIKYI